MALAPGVSVVEMMISANGVNPFVCVSCLYAECIQKKTLGTLEAPHPNIQGGATNLNLRRFRPGQSCLSDGGLFAPFNGGRNSIHPRAHSPIRPAYSRHLPYDQRQRSPLRSTKFSTCNRPGVSSSRCPNGTSRMTHSGPRRDGCAELLGTHQCASQGPRQSHQHRKDFHCRSKLALEPIRSTDWDFSYNRMGSESSSERRWGCFCEQRMP